jgi:hypothetical protein
MLLTVLPRCSRRVLQPAPEMCSIHETMQAYWAAEWWSRSQSPRRS